MGSVRHGAAGGGAGPLPLVPTSHSAPGPASPAERGGTRELAGACGGRAERPHRGPGPVWAGRAPGGTGGAGGRRGRAGQAGMVAAGPGPGPYRGRPLPRPRRGRPGPAAASEVELPLCIPPAPFLPALQLVSSGLSPTPTVGGTEWASTGSPSGPNTDGRGPCLPRPHPPPLQV